MAKKAYVGVNGIAKNVSKMYVGVNGVPKKVLKGYVGVNGVPKLFFDGGSTPVVVPSWDYWTSAKGNKPALGIYKTNNKIAYYAITQVKTTGTTNRPLLLSPDADAVTYSYQGYTFTAQGSITDATGLTWYYNGWQFQGAPYNPEYLLNRKLYSANDIEVAAQDMLDMIYSVPFHEDYQVGTEYRIPACGDVLKTIRKIVGWQLAKCVSEYTNTLAHYKEYSDNIDTIINSIMSYIQSHNNQNGVVILDVIDSVGYWDWGVFLYVVHGHYDSALGNKINYLDKATPTQKIDSGNNGFPCYLLEYKYDYGEGEITENYYTDGVMERETFLYMNDDGTYTITDGIAGDSGQWGTRAFIGLHGNAISNLGIDL